MHHARPTSFAVCLLGLTLLGCGGGHAPTYRAAGTVAYRDGSPLPGGWIEFRPIDAPQIVSARAPIGTNGAFELSTFAPGDGAIEGRHAVLVIPPTPSVDIDAVKVVPPAIDPRFRRFETSGLEFEVTQDSDKNRFQVVVERPKDMPAP